jgi:predicted molibdopterin-dependent oxidoreductase YjgC
MSRKCPTLNREADKALLQINRHDAEGLKIKNGEMVEMTSRRGTIRLTAEVGSEVPAGTVYTTFHYSEAPINLLCIGARDPLANCPEYKICAVKIESAK